MNVAIIGSRTFNNYNLLVETLDDVEIDCIISGGAKGADTLAEQYAKEFSLPIKIFKAEWAKYGKSAGMIRNTTIIENSNIIYAFWDGKSKGTLDSINKAKKLNKNLNIILT